MINRELLNRLGEAALCAAILLSLCALIILGPQPTARKLSPVSSATSSCVVPSPLHQKQATQPGDSATVASASAGMARPTHETSSWRAAPIHSGSTFQTTASLQTHE